MLNLKLEELLDGLDAMIDQTDRPALRTGQLGRQVDPEPLIDGRGDFRGA